MTDDLGNATIIAQAIAGASNNPQTVDAIRAEVRSSYFVAS